jgi:hypothetical protein
MAGAGYKLFNTGDVLTAAQVNTYLMEQTVMRFATTTARDTALTGVLAEGMLCYIDADNNIYKYTGSAWVNIDTSGGGSPLTTKGDLYTYSTTDARLPVGANGYTLVADSAETTGLKWAAPASGSTFVGCIATKTTTGQTLSNNTETAVTYNTEEVDTDNFHSTSTNTSRFTIPSGKAGKYLITQQLLISSNATGFRQSYLLKNGSATSLISGTIVNATNGDQTGAICIGVFDLAVGDYIEGMAYQNSGSSLTISAGADKTRFSIIYLGA